MKIQKILTTLSLAAGLSFGAFAQDIHFSQYYMSPMNLNPAMTGVMNCNGRFIANYRNQWASVVKANAFNTYAASYDMSIPVGRSDFFGGGISLWGDKAGSLDFATVQAKLSGSYSKRMGGYRKTSHYLVVGAEAGVAQRSIDFIKARYGNQHDGEGGFNSARDAGEAFTNSNYIFGDVGAGMLWFSNFSNGNNLHIGLAATHLNRANQSFNGNKFEGLYTKFTTHVGGEFMFTKKLGLVPNVAVFFQGPSMELLPGTALKFNLSKNKREYQAFQVGLWGRLNNHYAKAIGTDAMIITTRFDYNNVGLGFSYDLNISELRPASNMNGGFEFNLQYKICNGFKRADVCPNF